MKKSKKSQAENIEIQPIGHVRQKKGQFYLEILKKYAPALKELEKFSHVMVFWWADQNDNKKARETLQCMPPYGENPPVSGVFATRSEFRPNPIALTTTNILGIDHDTGVVHVPYIDAFDGSPIMDLKAYFPICDRVREAHIAPWLVDWPDWFEDAAEWWAAKFGPE